jgi:hypothetical protein
MGPSARDYGGWVVTCAAAELIGIRAGAAWWIAMDRIAPDPMTIIGKFAMLGLKSLSGVVEGVLLGLLQAVILRRLYPRLPIFRWVTLTALLAVSGWAAGSAIPIFGAFEGHNSVEPSLGLVVAFSGGFGLVVGGLFGGAQALALRQAAHRSYWWAISNAVGWAAALPVIYLAASFPRESTELWQALTAAIVSGAIAGLLLGAITGLSFWRMAPR